MVKQGYPTVKKHWGYV